MTSSIDCYGFPKAVGLYSPENEKDACGVGFIVNIDGQSSNKIIQEALVILNHMSHRGGCGCDQFSGDGTGIMTGIPHDLYLKILSEEGLKISLPQPGHYATGIFFIQNDAEQISICKEHFDMLASECQIQVLGWRKVACNWQVPGPYSHLKKPAIEQVFVSSSWDPETFKKQVFLLRKMASRHIPTVCERFYICSLSTKTIVYKGMLNVQQLSEFYLDIGQKEFKSHFAIIHNRFSTNTFPSWERAHPQRFLAHNGEINTLKGNINNMRAREGMMECGYYKDNLQKLFPVIEPGMSDSGCVDNAVEFLVMAGKRSLPEAIMTMVPEAWQNDETMSAEKRDYYKWSSCAMEPWDGPALFTFSDGRYVGAVLDRNGLRPSRYYITTDGQMIMASEVGVSSVPEEKVLSKGRLMPGRLLLVDTERGEVINDKELKHNISTLRPVTQWLSNGLVSLKDIHDAYNKVKGLPEGTVSVTKNNSLKISIHQDRRLPTFGYSVEDISMLVLPMIRNRKEAIGSMGNDTPLACLTMHPQLVFDYFKQLFAQVTNPPIDPFRETIVISLACPIGPESNLLDPGSKQCERLYLDHPIISCGDLQAIKECKLPKWKVQVIDTVYNVQLGTQGLVPALDSFCEQASEAIKNNCAFVILSDRLASKDYVPVSSLLALGAVHHHLLKTKQRPRVSIIVETAEAREIHHFCLLLGYGADAICPYLVFEVVQILRQEGLLDPPLRDDEVYKNLQAASFTGISKVMAKMGISTLQSYKAAQIFEAVGLHEEVIEKCFTGTASRISGVTFKVLAQEALGRHKIAFSDRDSDNVLVNNWGEYHWRDGGEKHVNDPRSIGLLQEASKGNNTKTFKKFVESTWRMVKACTLRGQMQFTFAEKPLDLAEVESASSIVNRFCTGAMSFGSISIETHETLAIAMNRMGGKSNTGEGGEKAERLIITDDLNNTRSAIKQIASGRFGVNSAYLAHADDLQIKMAQGAKPGEGGELPGHKVTPDIAKTRLSTLGVALISPPPHHDIYSIEDLAELIFNLKCSNPKSRISVKLVSEVGVGVIAAGVAKGHAEHIVISGHDGGTGASSWTGIKHAGLPWELGLSETHQTLVLNNLRRRVILQTDGQLRTGRDVVIAALLGADEFGFSTAPLISLGCTMMRKCHLNTCPVGIATQDPVLRKKFDGKPEYVINYFFMIAEEVREYMAQLGFKTMKEMIGQTQCIRQCDIPLNEKTKLLDFGKILVPAHSLNDGEHYGGTEEQEFGLEDRMENELIDAVQEVLDGKRQNVVMKMKIGNQNRSFGTTTSYHISRKLLDAGLPEDTVFVKVEGSAGQSFGAFICRGITLELAGDANDYVGKGLSGGKIILYPGKELPKSFKAEENIIAGNVCLYGATSGKAYFRGVTAERFCVRNSGAVAVCEGCGDHGCEYMTGGTVVILGPTGRNFAAGMSGGIAYIYDSCGRFPSLCNTQKVDLDPLQDKDITTLKHIVQDHFHYTQSTVAKTLLDNWNEAIQHFVKVIPREYKEALRFQEKEAKLNENVVQQNGEKMDTKEDAKEEVPLRKDSVNEIADIEESVPNETEEKNIDKQRGFVRYKRRANAYRPPKKRVKDWNEIYNHPKDKELKVQTARCMDCGVPFCQSKTGCPLGNVIPKWNDLVFHGQWQDALDRLLQTNNFPEFTGRVCPAPCEGACVLSINSKPVTIKSIECKIIDVAFEKGWMKPQPPQIRTSKTVAIIGSGPAGLAAAAQLNKAGHLVTVYEKNNRCGGLLMYGIPSMKIEKEIVERRVNLLADEGINFVPNTEIGHDISGQQLLSAYDAILLAIGSTIPRDLQIPGRELSGIQFAMDFLERNQKKQFGYLNADVTDARDKNVIVIGGGDTGVDCVATCVRQNARKITTFELLNEPPKNRNDINPWPQWPRVFRIEYGHEEVAIKYGKDPRQYNTLSKEFIGDGKGNITGIRTVKVEWVKDISGRWAMVEVPNSEHIYKADLVLIALGFTGPGKTLAKELGLRMDMRSNFSTERKSFNTNLDKVYAAGDCRYGQSLVVTAIAEGRQAARQIDLDLMGTTSLAGPGGVIVDNNARSNGRSE